MSSLPESLARVAWLGTSVLGATVHRPAAPLKLNLCLTYWCQYRCKTCNIWQRKPVDELTTDEILALVRENPDVAWLDLTGGEIFLRPDIEAVLEGIVAGWRRLAVLHFPTNGFLTDKIVRAVRKIAGRGPARTIVTVSLDGDEALNDEIRGIKGGFARQVETFKALRTIPGISTVFGMTLSRHNVGQFQRTFEAVRRVCPDLTADDLHLNIAQVSGHYYGNEGGDVSPDAAAAAREIATYRRHRGSPRSVEHLLESVYLSYMQRYLDTGRTPMPCHALRSSCFIDPWGAVYPCITYARPVGRLRETGMRLQPIWTGEAARHTQSEIWRGQCPQCWTACEAYQSILGNALAGRWTMRAAPAVPSAAPSR
jgi:radical SAM protein with 4Fe4S-binding SPASM domain